MKRLTALLLTLLITVALVGCSKPKPTLKVTAQQEGAGILIRMETTDFVIGKTGHVHIQLDGGPQVMPNTASYTIPKVAPGKHKVFVELSDPNHNPIGVDQEVEVEVK